MDLFDQKDTDIDLSPLADKMRPRALNEFVGQSHLLGPGSLLRRAIEEDRLFSMIFWGPPGSGKTTLARVIAHETKSHFVSFSAVLSGVKEIRAVVDEAQSQWRYHRKKTILFVDEIHRFNKAQQDAFLPHVEKGLITLIGATTENPSFEVISPLLSRTRVMLLKPYSDSELAVIINRAVHNKEKGLGDLAFETEPDAVEHIIWSADGDARMALNSLEAAASLLRKEETGARKITRAVVEEALQKKALQYDKGGEEHYNLISAFHKSLRGSDPDAALYWLGRMLAAGEDPLYIARRMVRFASEDVGNAEPAALGISVSAMQAFHFIGLPEGELALAQAAVYLATAPKSNSLYIAYGKVKERISETGTLAVPLHITARAISTPMNLRMPMSPRTICRTNSWERFITGPQRGDMRRSSKIESRNGGSCESQRMNKAKKKGRLEVSPRSGGVKVFTFLVLEFTTGQSCPLLTDN